MRGKGKDRSPPCKDLCYQQSPKDTSGVGEAGGPQTPPRRGIHVNTLQTLLHIPHLGLNRNCRPSHLHVYQNNGNDDTNPALSQGSPRYHWLSYRADYKVPKRLLNNPFAMKRPLQVQGSLLLEEAPPPHSPSGAQAGVPTKSTLGRRSLG